MRWNVAAAGLLGLLAQSTTAIEMNIDDDRKGDPNYLFVCAYVRDD